MSTVDQVGSYSVTEISLDVSAAVPVEDRCSMACTLFVPDALGSEPTVVVSLPAAAVSRKYFDIELPGKTGYSQARYFAERGIVWASFDYLGGGDSSRPEGGEALTIPVLADAAHEAVVGLTAGLRDGSLLGRRIESFRLVGYGFSFGAALWMVQQAIYEDFELIVTCGYSPLVSAESVGSQPENWEGLSAEEKRASVLKSNEEWAGGPMPVYHSLPRSGFWQSFYVEGTPEDLLRYDDEVLATSIPRSAGVDAMTNGFVRPYSSQISVPVMLAFGDQDATVDTHIQTTAYPACSNLLLTTYPDMGHMHNFCERRTSLWDRAIAWLEYARVDRSET